MTTSGDAQSGKDGKQADGAEAQALRLLALEAAGAAPAEQRRLLAASAPVLAMLMQHFLVHDIQSPDWPDRDRLILSSSLQPLACALLHLLGRENESDILQEQSTTGAGAVRCDLSSKGLDLPLDLPGHGLAAGVGMALAARLLRERFGEEIFNHATCVVVSDRDLEPGIAQETIAITPWLRPHRLCVLHLTAVKSDGTPDGLQHCPNHLARFAAAGWHVQQAHADDPESIMQALEQVADQGVATWEERRPAYVAVEYDAGLEVPSTTFLRQQPGWEDIAAGDVPGTVRDEWRLVGLRGRKARKAWEQRLEELPAADRKALQQRLENPLPEEFRQRMRALRIGLAEEAQARDLQKMLPFLLRESAQPLPELTIVAALHDVPTEEDAPRSDDAGAGEETIPALEILDVGLRPLAVAALLAGMAAHGGVRPVGMVRRHQLAGMLPMLEEAGRTGLNAVLLVLEDERCRHAPVDLQAEQLICMCPADAVELVECWQLCVQKLGGVVMLFVPSGNTPGVRSNPEKANLSALGGYELLRAEGDVQLTLFAAGRPVAAAMAAARRLEQQNVLARVVSVPIPQRLMQQNEAHWQRIMHDGTPLRFMLPPGEVAHAWSLLGCEKGIISPCAEDGRLLNTETLAERICKVVMARLNDTLQSQGEAPLQTGDSKQETRA